MFMVAAGSTISVDLAEYLPEETTGFSVGYSSASSGGRVDIRVRGSVAMIRGVQEGKTVITLTGTRSGQRVSRQAVVEVTPFSKN